MIFSSSAARRTDSAYSRLIGWARQPDALVSSGGFGYGRVNLGKAAALPEVAASATLYQVGFYPATTSGRLLAIGGGGGITAPTVRDQRLLGRVKVLEGRRADPKQVGEVEVGFASEDFTHVRVGTHLLLHFWSPHVNPLQFARGIAQASANFHSQLAIEIGGALHVSDVRHGDQACDFGSHELVWPCLELIVAGLRSADSRGRLSPHNRS